MDIKSPASTTEYHERIRHMKIISIKTQIEVFNSNKIRNYCLYLLLPIDLNN